MTLDISLDGLLINENGSEHKGAGLPGIVSLSWFHSRPDLLQNAINWSYQIKSIKDGEPIDLDDIKWFEKLAFRQNAIGKSVIKIEVVTIKEYGLIPKIVAGIIGLGIKTVGGLIINPIATSIYETITSQLEIPEKSVFKVGVGYFEIDDPKTITSQSKTIDLEVKNKIVIREGNIQTTPTNRVDELAILPGKNGTITLKIEKY